jgi:outer membrane protein OmpA-like peptidoglycan-associated protein
MKKLNTLLAIALIALIMSSCNPAEGEFTGSEYMPDMAHSIAYEAHTNNYYSLNRRHTKEEDYLKMIQPRNPVTNTIPRGYAGYTDNTALWEARQAAMKGLPMNGSSPYYYGNTDADRARAIAEINGNPFPLTENGLAQGKNLYNIYCGICHGEKADGNGYLVADKTKDGKPKLAYPNQPTNLVNDELKASSNGRFYHTIMHGKGVMGAYKDKMSFEERWQVIHYIRSLQFGAEYKPKAYTVGFDSSAVTTAIAEALESGKASVNALEFKNVAFATGSNELIATSRDELDILASILLANKEIKIQINGHTDNVGDPAKNLKLSEGRAKAVFDYLVKKGVNAANLSFKGYGDTNPKADNTTDGGRAQNRRTDVTILGK